MSMNVMIRCRTTRMSMYHGELKLLSQDGCFMGYLWGV